MEIITRPEPFDAIVVGSGATGGVAAKELAEAGLKVLVLEAGKTLEKSVHGSQVSNLGRQLYRHFVSKRQHVQELHGGYWEVNPELFVDDVDNPYTTPEGKPYRWIRGRHVGGRSLTWGGVTFRLSDYEFKAASHDGYGEDWPLSHGDLSPFYGKLERFLGTHGSKEGLAQLPDGEFLEARPLSPGEVRLKEVVESRWKDRRLIPSRGIRAARHPDKGEAFSRLSSTRTTLAAALATGKCTLQSDAVVARVLVDPATGKATGIEYLDRTTSQVHHVYGRLIYLCASTIESLRIMMNSKSQAHPQGIGASSGILGRYVMDHIVANIYFYLPDVPNRPGEFQLLGSDSCVIPRFQNLGSERASHLRGFGIWGGIDRLPFPALLQRKRGVAFGFLCAMGEALPHADNLVRLDEEKRDKWGLPAAHISCSWTENDLAVAKAAQAATEEMVKAAGGVVAPLTDLVRTPLITSFMKKMQDQWAPTLPGLFVHEVGGARMGNDPKTSVVNPFCQVWDAKNVFVTDGACWVSSGWQNPTLTEMAITARACAHGVEALKRRDL